MAEAPEQRPRGRVGTTVRGKYHVDAFLATGTMANVYAATHRNGSRVALKVLHKELAGDAHIAERFRREGYFANSIGHPGIVRAIDDDTTEDGCAFLVMELLEGETLEERRKRKGGRLALSEVLGIAEAVLDTLAAAHANNVLHRDMKPDNVFITTGGDVKILDFGVARFNDGQTSSEMTGVGMVLGTPAFMPPEQALGRREIVDARSDLWAVGATIFVAVTGESVHAGGDAKTKLIAAARTPARPIQEVLGTIPTPVAQVIDRALAYDRDERWPDAYSMRDALRKAMKSVERAVPPAPTTRRAFDEEPTVARTYNAAEDVVTSAPPITARAAMASANEITLGGAGPAPSSMLNSSGPVFSLRNDPVFSLRRTKDEEPPETERFERPADDEPKSIDVKLSFTRPMAAIVMPEELGGPPATTPPMGSGTVPFPETPIPAPIPAAGRPPEPTLPVVTEAVARDVTLPIGAAAPVISHAGNLGFGVLATSQGGMPAAPTSTQTPAMPVFPAPIPSVIVQPPPAPIASSSSPPATESVRGENMVAEITRPRSGLRVVMTLLLGFIVLGAVGGAIVRYRVARAGGANADLRQPTPTASASATGTTASESASGATAAPSDAPSAASAAAPSASVVVHKPHKKKKPPPPATATASDTAATATSTSSSNSTPTSTPTATATATATATPTATGTATGTLPPTPTTIPTGGIPMPTAIPMTPD